MRWGAGAMEGSYQKSLSYLPADEIFSRNLIQSSKLPTCSWQSVFGLPGSIFYHYMCTSFQWGLFVNDLYMYTACTVNEEKW